MIRSQLTKDFFLTWLKVLLDILLDITPHSMGHTLHNMGHTLHKVTLHKVVILHRGVTLHRVTLRKDILRDIHHKATHRQDILLQVHIHQLVILVHLLHIIQGMELVAWGHYLLAVLLPPQPLMEPTRCHMVGIILHMGHTMGMVSMVSMESSSMGNLGDSANVGSMECLVECMGASSRSGSKFCFRNNQLF